MALNYPSLSLFIFLKSLVGGFGRGMLYAGGLLYILDILFILFIGCPLFADGAGAAGGNACLCPHGRCPLGLGSRV